MATGVSRAARMEPCEPSVPPLPCYIFDVHDDGPAEWGDQTLAGAGRKEIEDRARQLIGEAQERQRDRGDAMPLTTVFVHHDDGGVVLTAYGRAGQDVWLVWAPS